MPVPDFEVLEVMKPIFGWILPLLVLLMIIFAIKCIKEISTHAISKKEITEPKEDIYYDSRKNGYWVKMSDGSRSFVGMKDLYPNDVDFQSEIKVVQPGHYVWDSVNMKFKEKGV